MSDARREAGGARRETRGARFDEVIDRAVREMLDVEPPAGLRARVMDRLERPRRTFAWAWIAVPVAAAAVIILAVLAPWRHAAPPVVTTTPPSVARVDPPPIIAVPPVPKLPERRGPGSMQPPRATPAGQRPSPLLDRPVVAADATVGVDTEATVIDPLAPIAPIAVAGARPQDITPKQITISALAPIVELQIAPLSPPERRN